MPSKVIFQCGSQVKFLCSHLGSLHAKFGAFCQKCTVHLNILTNWPHHVSFRDHNHQSLQNFQRDPTPRVMWPHTNARVWSHNRSSSVCIWEGNGPMMLCWVIGRFVRFQFWYNDCGFSPYRGNCIVCVHEWLCTLVRAWMAQGPRCLRWIFEISSSCSCRIGVFTFLSYL